MRTKAAVICLVKSLSLFLSHVTNETSGAFG